MPTARELLEQADALMRRNRRRDRDQSGGPPTLTDALGIDRDGTLAPTLILPDAVREAADSSSFDATRDTADSSPLDAAAEPIALDTLSDVPVLTDVVDVWPAGETPDAFVEGRARFVTESAIEAAGTLDDALEADALAAQVDDPEPVDVQASDAGLGGEATRDAAELGDAFPASPAHETAESTDASSMPPAHGTAESTDAFPMQPIFADIAAADSGAATSDERAGDRSETTRDVPAALPPIDDEFILEIPPPSEGGAARESNAPLADVAAAHLPGAVQPGSPDWDAMAEEIRMQVLQRLDLFTDTGMRDQLGARLRPIVDRASAELVETINHQLGELVRGYVAEAIEREIESWRKRSG